MSSPGGSQVGATKRHRDRFFAFFEDCGRPRLGRSRSLDSPQSSKSEGAELTPEADEVLEKLAEIEDRRNQILEPLRQELKKLLQEEIAGRSFGEDIISNRAVASQVQQLLQKMDMRIKCPRSDCQEPAYLLCNAAGRARRPTFQFRHLVGSRQVTHGSSRELPAVLETATPKPDRRRSSEW